MIGLLNHSVVLQSSHDAKELDNVFCVDVVRKKQRHGYVRPCPPINTHNHFESLYNL